MLENVDPHGLCDFRSTVGAFLRQGGAVSGRGARYRSAAELEMWPDLHYSKA